MSTALKTLEKIKESLDGLNSMIRGFMEKAGEEAVVGVEAAKPEVAETDGEVKVEVKASEELRPGRRKGGINRSDLIREHFRKHGMEIKNKDLIESLEKTHKVKIEPSLVSTIRKKMHEGKKPAKAAKAKTTKDRAKVQVGEMKGLPMPALCAVILKKSGKEGLKLKEVTERVIEAGYEYKGNKGNLGIAQNVYQALHTLSQKKSHPGYNGKVAVILHDESSKRWKLNPKAVRARKIA
jgi:hypothetical protein